MVGPVGTVAWPRTVRDCTTARMRSAKRSAPGTDRALPPLSTAATSVGTARFALRPRLYGPHSAVVPSERPGNLMEAHALAEEMLDEMLKHRERAVRKARGRECASCEERLAGNLLERESLRPLPHSSAVGCPDGRL